MVKRAKTATRPRGKQGTKTQDNGPDNEFDKIPTKEDYGEMIAAIPDSLFDRMGEDSYVQVRRVNPVTKQPEFLFKLAPYEASEEVIQQFAGGGTFYLRERVRDEQSGDWTWGRHRTIYIGGEPRKVTDLPKSAQESLEPAGKVGQAPAAPASNSDHNPTLNDAMVASIMSIMKGQADASNMQMKAMEMAMVKHLSQPQINWVEVLSKVADPVVELVKASRNKGVERDPLELVEKIASIMTSLRETTSPAQSFGDMVKTMNDVLELKERAGPPEEDPLLSMAGRFLGVIEKSYKETGKIPTQQQLVAGVRQEQSGATPQQVPEWAKLLRAFKAQLVANAARDNDPEQVANYIFDIMPEVARGSVHELLVHPELETQVFSVAPELRQYPRWTGRFFQALADNYEEGEEVVGGEAHALEVKEAEQRAELSQTDLARLVKEAERRAD